MATIYNSDLFKELASAGKIQVSVDNIPNQLAEKVVPVMEVNPKLLRRTEIIRHNDATNATSASIYTTPANADFYLTHLTISTMKDAGSTATFSAISCVIDGITRYAATLGFITLTASRDSLSINFSTPIKIDRNTSIGIVNSAAAANIITICSIGGYIDYIPKA